MSLWEQVTMGTSFGISQTKQIRMPKLQEHHSKGSQWCKINIDLFHFFDGRYN